MKKKITAAELMAKLNADPVFVSRRDQKESERVKQEAEYKRAEAPLVNALRAAGFMVESSWDLVNTAVPYSGALEILLDHLSRPYPAAVREGIARALAVPQAKFAWKRIVKHFCDEQEARAKSGLAVTVAATADNETIEELIALARDSRHGSSRVLLLRALDRSSDPRARAALVGLATDPELKLEVEFLLRRPVKPRRSRNRNANRN
jgi:HEAT repeat protein